MAFELVSGLAAKDYVTDLKLCRVLFEDNKYYPWIFLVPMKENTKNMTNLTMEERFQLMREIALAEKVMMSLFPCDQDNVAMIGNMTPQLHVHVVCRKKAIRIGREQCGILPELNMNRQKKKKLLQKFAKL